MPKLIRKTRRLIVRPMTPKDYSAWRTAHTTMLPKKNLWDPSNRKPEDVTRAKFRKSLQHQAKTRKNDQFYDLAVFEKKSGEMIGIVAAMNVERGVAHTAYLGYIIYNRYWGKGYAKEAVKAMFDIAFRDIKLHRLEAGIEPSNKRSIALAKSLGLRKEGLKKRAIRLRDKWVDLLMYSVTSEEKGIRWKGKAQPRMR